jgi:insulysin
MRREYGSRGFRSLQQTPAVRGGKRDTSSALHAVEPKGEAGDGRGLRWCLGALPRIENLERPERDDRIYRIITLPNQLEVLLINDVDTDKASAALDVNVGSFIPGVAHALEHFLFMGSKKYPGENEFDLYITNRGGRCNAHTVATSTNFFFELSYPTTARESATTEPEDNSPLWGGMDRLAHFCIKPLLRIHSINREIKVVDLENEKNRQNDVRRIDQLDKTLANPDHPYSQFPTGNCMTLQEEPKRRCIDIHKKFKEFYDSNYSANRMKLVVLGREKMDTLEKWALDTFGKIRNKNLTHPCWNMPINTEKELLIQIFAEPISEMRSLNLQFLYRDEDRLYESCPSRYLIHLLGHKGPGSTFAYLKKKGWAENVVAGMQTPCLDSGLLSVTVSLTKEGVAKYKEVVKVIFHYIGITREWPPQKWIVDELMQMSSIDFRLKQKSLPIETTSSLVGTMQKPYDRTKLLSGPMVISKFDADEIDKSLSYLRPDNFRVIVTSRDFPGDCDQRERWYGTGYKSEKIPQSFLAEITEAFESKSRPAELHLPRKNNFIPNQLDVERIEVNTPTKGPSLIRYDGSAVVWWKKDDRFFIPKANVYLLFRTPVTLVTVHAKVMCMLFCGFVKDSLEEELYDACVAGLEYDISNHDSDLCIVVHGYNDKLQGLLEKILLRIRGLKMCQGRFDAVHERTSRSLRNRDHYSPYEQIVTYSETFKVDTAFTNEEQLEVLKGVTAEDLEEFYSKVFVKCPVEVLAHGNLQKEKAFQIADLAIGHDKPLANQQHIRQTLTLPLGSDFIHEKQLKNPDNANRCIEYSLFIGSCSNSVRAMLLLIGQMMREPCFNQLRTIEQLCYHISSGASFLDDWAGYCIRL